jgi:hypothetical protein
VEKIPLRLWDQDINWIQSKLILGMRWVVLEGVLGDLRDVLVMFVEIVHRLVFRQRDVHMLRLSVRRVQGDSREVVEGVFFCGKQVGAEE